ncbi:odorant receptor 45a-like [Cochliomyia hominivorax]
MFKLKSASDSLPPQNGIENYFATQTFAFNFLGINATSKEKTIFNPFLTWIPMMFLVALSIFMLVYAIESRRDMYLVTDILPPFWQSLLALIKIWCFLWNRRKIVKLIRHIWLWNLKADGDELKIIVEENAKERLYSILFHRWVMVTVMMAFLSPILVAYFYYLKGYEFMDNLDLPLKAAYHWVVNPKSYNGYLLAYIWNIITISYILHCAIANDTLFSWFAHNVSAQFRILNLRFKNTALSSPTKNDECNFIRSIILHIKYHQRVIELADSFNDVFMVTVFFKYFISFLQIACLIFQIARVGELSTVVFHMFFLMSVSLQLMMYCRGGQRIIDESTSIAVTIYEYFQWHEMSAKSRKLMLLPMMRSQRPCFLTGVFFVADFPLFLWTFKTAGSLFTMLKSMES